MAAAAEADGQRWWPGSLPSAVGVVMDEDWPRGCVEVRGGAGRDVVVAAAPYPRPIPGVPVERNLNGISLAVAKLTGMVGRVTEGRGGALTVEGCRGVVGVWRWGSRVDLSEQRAWRTR